MPNFAKRCRKQLRRILYSNVCSCVCPVDLKDQPEPTALNPPETVVVSQKLELLLLKTLKHQLEEREYHDQLKCTLTQITKILEQFGKTNDLHQKISQHFPNDGFSKFTVTISKDSLIHCQTDARKKSLLVLGCEGVVNEGVQKVHSVVLHKCHKQDVFNVSEPGLIPQGHFSAILCRRSDDKAVQYDSTISFESSDTNSKLIQTHFLNISNFNIKSFKRNMVKHMRNMRQDVISLKQLLYSLEHYPAGCRLNAKDVSISSSNMSVCREREVEYKFFAAKTRAANFVKFYKLRKVQVKGGDKKKNKGRGGGSSN